MMLYMDLLGKKGTDTVTGFKGIVTSVGYDLYGCVQVILCPEATKEGKLEDSRWFDAKRIVVTGKPVMDVPNFEIKEKGEEDGPELKPTIEKKVKNGYKY